MKAAFVLLMQKALIAFFGGLKLNLLLVGHVSGGVAS